MAKFIEVALGDWVYQIPLSVVATNRAKYYADVDSRIEDDDFPDPMVYDQTYKDEYEYTYNDSIEARDWVRNNMTWGEVADSAKRVRAIKAFSLMDLWDQKMGEGDFEIVEG